MISRSIQLLLIFGLLGLQSVMAGGAWPQKKGGAFIKVSEWWVVFDQHYTDAGLIDPNVTTGIFNTSVYAEYGFTDRFTGIFNGSLFSRNYMNNLVSGTTGEVLVAGEAINRFGDIDLGMKYGLTKPGAKVPMALTLFLGIPTGTPVAGALQNLQTGDGEFNQILQFDAGKGFRWAKGVSGYAGAYVGFNRRSKGFSEEFRYGLESGAGFFENRLWLTARLIGVESLKNGATAATVTSTSIFANNTEYLSWGLETSLKVTPKIGVSASVAGAFRGEIIAAAPSYSVGVFLDLGK